MSQSTAAIFDELGFRFDRSNLYHQVAEEALEAAELIEAPRYLQLILAQPKVELMVHFPVRLDGGEYQLFKGYRVQHNNILGPYKGGMRFHPDVSLDHTKALALLMTIKNAVMQLPLGGGKGGVQCNPRELSEGELIRLTRRFTAALGKNIGPEHDIPAPDVGTNSKIMGWMADTHINMFTGGNRTEGLAVVTGKPVSFGGSLGREKATGQGLVDVLDEMLHDFGVSPNNCTFSLVGFGNVGSWAGRLLHERGSRMMAVMDHTGAIYNEDGLDAQALATHVGTTGGIAGFPDSEPITTEEFYRTRVDLFIPAALEQMITRREASQLDCKVVAEAANAPTTGDGEAELKRRGIPILPAILCNAGGVTVSYLEWKQNRQATKWSAEAVDAELKAQMTDAARRVRDLSNELGCDLRSAAYASAMQHLTGVYSIRGIFP